MRENPMKNKSDYLPRSTRVTTYRELDQWVAGFAAGAFPLEFLIGRPGLGKSQRALRALEGRPHAWIDCHATKLAVYCKLFQHRDEPVAIDDENSLVTDPGKLSLMSALCQTNPEKTLRWDSTTRLLEDRGVPPEFKTRSQVLVITNRLRNLSPQVAAMIDRGFPIIFEPSAAEIHQAVADWLTDREVYEFIGCHLPLIPELSMRDYWRAERLKKQGGMDWRAALHRQWRSGRLVQVVELRSDPSFASEEDRARAFVSRSAGSRATYFRCVERLRRLGALPR
jgi:hypothetical protein